MLVNCGHATGHGHLRNTRPVNGRPDPTPAAFPHPFVSHQGPGRAMGTRTGTADRLVLEPQRAAETHDRGLVGEHPYDVGSPLKPCRSSGALPRANHLGRLADGIRRWIRRRDDVVRMLACLIAVRPIRLVFRQRPITVGLRLWLDMRAMTGNHFGWMCHVIHSMCWLNCDRPTDVWSGRITRPGLAS